MELSCKCPRQGMNMDFSTVLAIIWWGGMARLVEGSIPVGTFNIVMWEA